MSANLEAFLQVAFLVAVPAVALRVEKHVEALGAVAICFLTGMAMGNVPWISIDQEVAVRLSSVAVALAIPLLLFSLDLRAWLARAPRAVLAFAWAMVAACLATTITLPFFAARIPESPKVAGMLVGTYTGGPPNLAAVGTMLGVDSATLVMVNAADALVSAPYFVFLITVGPAFFGKVLPASEVGAESSPAPKGQNAGVSDMLIGLALAGVVVALGMGASRAVAGVFSEDIVAILVVTTIAIALSFHRGVRGLRGSFQVGNYILLVFCVAVGSISNFGEVVSSSIWIVAYVVAVVLLALAIHLGLCRASKIDRDTTIITSAAAVFGPAVIGPVSLHLGNRRVFVSGLMASLVGYAVGNYLGLAIAWLCASMA